ncbi:MAG: hypothetical protein K9N47_13315 [Prosthecobacter sp.]|uniref:hypothetical protein n=1 Tax=Prosthecobacter sp. TaxID=1965333 RepID=UPI0025F1CEF6|nr:hypothetical protein [Prosthecobacter sp.]MCF7787099.1 hypothetical protein [Prosthecobacter sp.]
MDTRTTTAALSSSGVSTSAGFGGADIAAAETSGAGVVGAGAAKTCGAGADASWSDLPQPANQTTAPR